jgi:colanic acid biosynthesis protein WcaH
MFIDQDLYLKIREVMPTVCVDLIVTNPNGEYLLLQRKEEPAKGLWWIPGGRIHKNESWRDAASRKSMEELGVCLELVEFVSLEESMFPNVNYHTVNVTVHMAYNELDNLRIDSNHSKYRWEKHILDGLHEAVVNPLKKLGFRFENEK